MSMSDLFWIGAAALTGMAVIAIGLSRSRSYSHDKRWVPPHERHIQDTVDGEENLSQKEREALAELEALHLHRKHPYC